MVTHDLELVEKSFRIIKIKDGMLDLQNKEHPQKRKKKAQTTTK